ncbi:MAG: HAD family hydrolase [Clostridia bacterium]|nr:HAD family hydrolase [Clostridia bacterium]
MGFKALFVDFYGTIVHEDDKVVEKILQTVCKTGTTDNLIEVDNYWRNEILSLFENSHGELFKTQRVIEKESLGRTLKHFNSKADLSELCEMMNSHKIKPPIFDDSISFFTNSPLPIYIVSNIDTSDIYQAITYHDLHPVDVFTSEDAKSYKPRLELFNLALQKTGLNGCEILHIGDSIANDVIGASKAGIRALWLNRLKNPVPDGVTSICNLEDTFGFL